jgi:hypothetical protein
MYTPVPGVDLPAAGLLAPALLLLLLVLLSAGAPAAEATGGPNA